MHKSLAILLAIPLVAQTPATPAKPAPAQPAPAPQATQGAIVETIVVRVNNEIITLSEYQKSRESLRQELQQKYQGMQLTSEMATRDKNVLRDLIDNLLLLQKGKDLGINVDTQVVKRMDDFRKQMGLPNMEEFEKAVAAQGLNFEDYKANIRNNMITQQVIGREVGSKIQMNPEDVKKFYEEHKKEMERPEQVHLSEILVSTEGKEGDALAASEKKATDVVARARKGEKFDELAAKESEGESGKRGGDIGLYKRGDMAKEIEAVSFGLKKGDVSDPIHIKNGFLILKLNEHYEAGIPPMKEVENEIQEQIYYERLQPNLRDFMTKLRDEAYLEIRSGFTDSGAPAVLSAAHLIPVDAAAEEMTTTLAGAKKGGRKILKPWTWPKGSKK